MSKLAEEARLFVEGPVAYLTLRDPGPPRMGKPWAAVSRDVTDAIIYALDGIGIRLAPALITSPPRPLPRRSAATGSP